MNLSRMTALLAPILALVLAGPAAAQAKKPEPAPEPRFKAVCHFDNETIAAEAQRTAEQAWTAAEKLIGPVPKSKPEPPAEVHLYIDPKQLQEAAKANEIQLAKGRLYFTSAKNRSAHILVQPLTTPEVLVVSGLPLPTRQDIARRAVDLARFKMMPTPEAHPEWLAQGLANWLADRVLIEGGWAKSYDEDPMLIYSIQRALELQRSGQLPSLTQIGQGLRSADATERAAVQELLFAFLMTGDQAANFGKVLAEAKTIKHSEKKPYDKTLAEEFERRLGLADKKGKLDGDWRMWVGKLRPQWEQIFYSLELREKEWVQFASSDSVNAVCWRLDPVNAPKYTLEGSLRIFPGGGQRQMNILLDRSDNGFISIAIVDMGPVLIWRYENDKWVALATEQPKINFAQPHTFSLSVDAPKVTLSIDGNQVATAEVPGRSLSGPWGLGAQAGSAGEWGPVSLKK